jgi:hypothetical protein
MRCTVKLLALVAISAFYSQCLADEKPIELTAAAIHKEFKTDEKAAKKKYEGKLLQISGMSGGQTGTDTFYLKEKKDSDVIVTAAYFNATDAEKAKLKAIKPNTKVVIVGKYRAFLLNNVELDDTRLVKIEK